MKVVDQVLKFIRSNKMIKSGQKILVAVSGGADSVALLHLLYRWQTKLNITLHVAHLNHMFRGAEAQKEALFVVALCATWQVPCTSETIDVPKYRRQHRLSSQAASREVRYRFLERVARECGAAKIALGHHADDQAETVLLHLLRGAGTGGLAGIAPVRNNRYIRPLLSTRRRDIESYCGEHDLQYQKDSSNQATRYLRNRVRQHLMPVLAQGYNPEIVPALGRLAAISRAEELYLTEQAQQALNSLTGSFTSERVVTELHRQKFNELPLALKRRVIRLVWQKITGDQRDLSFDQVESIIKQAGTSSLATLALPGGVNCEVAYDQIQFICRQQAESELLVKPEGSYVLNIPGTTLIKDLGILVTAKVASLQKNDLHPALLPKNEVMLDYHCTGADLLVRSRHPGDKFKPQGAGGTVKLKKFFIDQKIPQQKRDLLPLVCKQHQIIWVTGLRVGEEFKVTSATKKILRLKVAVINKM